MEFKAFPKTPRVDKLNITLTRKYDGTNAQIAIAENWWFEVGSRNRWISIANDNFGFAAWVYENQRELIPFLGPGRHYGEWCGPGINSGEGFKEKTLVLFDQHRYDRTKLPKNVILAEVVDKLIVSRYLDTLKQILEHAELRKDHKAGIEGVVLNVAGSLFKHVYREEDTPKPKNKSKMADSISTNLDVSGLLQSVRLSKLLTRDEQYIRDYPNSLKNIVKAYVKDLEDEQQLSEVENEKRSQKKALSKVIFPFIRSEIEQKFTQSNNSHSPITPDNATG